MGRDQSQIRIKSEVGTVKHVEALQFFFFTGADFVDRRFKCLKTWPLPCVCVCACVCWWGGGGQDVITIQTSTMTPLSAIVSHVSTARGVCGWGRDYKCSLLSKRVLVYMRALNNNGNEHRR